jgi:hypothetical protein
MNMKLLSAVRQGENDGPAMRGEEEITVTVTGGSSQGKNLLSRWVADFLDDMGHEVRCVSAVPGGEETELDFWSPMPAKMEPVRVKVVDEGGSDHFVDFSKKVVSCHPGVGEGDSSLPRAVLPNGYRFVRPGLRGRVAGGYPLDPREEGFLVELLEAYRTGGKVLDYYRLWASEDMSTNEARFFLGSRLQELSLDGVSVSVRVAPMQPRLARLRVCIEEIAEGEGDGSNA